MARYRLLDEEGNPLNIIIADAAFMSANYAEGTYELVPEPNPLPQVPTDTEVNTFRDELISAGTAFSVTGYGTVPLMGRLQDQIVLQSRMMAAQRAKAEGVTDPILLLRDAVNTNHTLTPDQMIELVTKGVTWVEAVMKVSWDMKDHLAPFEDGVPEDYTSPVYWPVGDGVA